MNVNLDFKEGFVVDNFESDLEVEFGCKKFTREGNSDSKQEDQVPIAKPEGSISRRRRRRKVLDNRPEFNPATDMNHPTFQLGLLFPDRNTLKLAIKEYAIQNGRGIYFKRNEPRRIRAQ